MEYLEVSSNLNNIDDLLEDFTTTFHNFGKNKTTKWKNDKVIDKLIYKKLEKSEKKAWLIYDLCCILRYKKCVINVKL